MTVFVLCSASFCAGALCAGAWMRWHRMAKRRAVRELQSECRSALDLECTQFSHEWGLPV